MATYAINKKARADYRAIETFEAGIKLTGAEVKSVKGGGMRLKGAYVTLTQGRLQLINAHIDPYKPAGVQPDYDPTHSRPLLVRKDEIKKISGMLNQKGLTMVPLSAFSKRNLIKIKFAVARGRKVFEKRERIKKREDQRTMRRAMRQKPR